jgi:hypothetical protein
MECKRKPPWSLRGLIFVILILGGAVIKLLAGDHRRRLPICFYGSRAGYVTSVRRQAASILAAIFTETNSSLLSLQTRALFSFCLPAARTYTRTRTSWIRIRISTSSVTTRSRARPMCLWEQKFWLRTLKVMNSTRR